MPAKCDVLKLNKSGNLNLSKKWLSANLNMGADDMVLFIRVDDDTVILKKFSPQKNFEATMKALKKIQG